MRLDIPWNGNGPMSSVGTVEVQLFRMGDNEPEEIAAHSEEIALKRHLNRIQRAPTFTEYASWTDLNPCINPAIAPPSFQVG